MTHIWARDISFKPLGNRTKDTNILPGLHDSILKTWTDNAQWTWKYLPAVEVSENIKARIRSYRPGSLTAWAVVVLLMDMVWYFDVVAVGGTILVCLVATLVIGFAGTWHALGQKAAPLLRNE